MLLGRSKSRRPQCKLDDLINHLKSQNRQQSQDLLRSLANQPEIQEYFRDFQLIADSLKFCTLRKYLTLDEGLYILLRGEIGCLLNTKFLKGQNHNRSKPYCRQGGYSFMINEPLTVFEASFTNCTAYQDSYLLKVSAQQAEMSLFQKERVRRKQLYQNQYLSQDHNQIYNIPQCHHGVLQVDLNIHSLFHFAKYTFRQIIKLSSPAIVSEGRAKLKRVDFNVREFDQYGVLLPNLAYEVTSSTLCIMTIRNHDTLMYSFDIHLHKSWQKQEKVRYFKENVQQTSASIGKKENAKYQRRKKEFSKISKQIENYSILPIFLCTQQFDNRSHQRQDSSQICRKRVDFHEKSNQLNQNVHQLDRPANEAHSDISKARQSSLYKTISSYDSAKPTKLYQKLNPIPLEQGQILSKIRNRLRQAEKYKSALICDLGRKMDSNYKECLSQQ